MKLAIIVNSFPKLSETFIYNKVCGLSESGMDITIITHSTSTDWAHYDKSKINKAKIIYSPIVKYQWLIALVRPFSLLNALIKIYSKQNNLRTNIKNILLFLPFVYNRYDIVHFEFSGVAVQYLDIIKNIDCRKFVSCRGAAEQIAPILMQNRGEELSKLFRTIDRVHCVSKDMSELLFKYGLEKDKYFINYPSIDRKKFIREKKVKSSPNTIVVLSVGRLHWKKGLGYGIQAINELINDGYNILYKIIGDGPEYDNLRYIIKDIKQESNILMLGRKSASEIKDIMEESHIFFLPSISEGISNSALEAMSMEIPVVSTRAGGMDEAITDMETGILVDSLDYRSMASGIKKLLDSSMLRSQLRKNASKKVEVFFNLDKQIKIFLKEYNKIDND